MPKLTKVEVAIKRIKGGIDKDFSNSLYDQMRYAMGVDTSWSPPEQQDDIPFYPELVMNSIEIAQSRTLMRSIQIMVSKLLSNQLGMRVTKAPLILQEVMQQYFQTRMIGDGTADGGWIEELRAAGSDGNALGVGVVQIGLEEDHKSGMQKTTVRRHSPWYVVFSPYVKNLSKTDWICFVHHLSPEDAEELFSEELARRFRKAAIRTQASGEQVDLVRVYEYFDLGVKGGDPTRILILGDLAVKLGDPRVKRSLNDFEVLPFAVCTGWESPILKRPFGRIINELPHEVARRKSERRIHQTLDQPPILVIDEKAINDEDLESYKKGIPMKYLRYKSESGNANTVVARIPGAEVSDNEWAHLQYTDQAQTKASGISEMERGVQSSKRQTRFETMALMNVGDINKSFEVFQQTIFVKRFLDKLFVIAKKFDKTPFSIMVQGQTVEFNQPGVQDSWLSEFLGEDYEIKVDVESLTGPDDDLKMSRKLAKLQSLAPEVAAGLINAQKYARRKLEIMGEDDIQEWLQSGPVPGSLPQQGGQRTFQEESLAQLKGGQEL